MAGGIYDMYLRMEYLLKQVFANTANSEYLTLQAQNRILEKLPTKATGGIGIYGTVGTTISTGTMIDEYKTTDVTTITNTTLIPTILTAINGVGTCVFDNPHNLINDVELTIATATENDFNGTFKVRVENDKIVHFDMLVGTILSDDLVTVKISVNMTVVNIEANETGVVWNIEPMNELELVAHIVGVELLGVVYNGVTGGRDEETTEQYRERFLTFLRLPHAQFTAQSIEEKVIILHPKVTRFFVINSANDIIFVCVDDNAVGLGLTTAELALIRETILLDLPITTLPNFITTVNAQQQVVPITVTNVIPSDNSLKVAIFEQLDFYFKSLKLGEDIDINILKGTIYGTIDYTTNTSVRSFDININADIIIADDNMAVMELTI